MWCFSFHFGLFCRREFRLWLRLSRAVNAQNRRFTCQNDNFQLLHSKASAYCSIRPGPEVIKLFSCSTQLSMIFSLLINVKIPTVVLLINVKMPTTVGILTFRAGKMALSASLSLKKTEFLDIFIPQSFYVIREDIVLY